MGIKTKGVHVLNSAINGGSGENNRTKIVGARSNFFSGGLPVAIAALLCCLMETSWRFSTTTFSSFSNHENTRTFEHHVPIECLSLTIKLKSVILNQIKNGIITNKAKCLKQFKIKFLLTGEVLKFKELEINFSDCLT
jgi:hypothetical protein